MDRTNRIWHIARTEGHATVCGRYPFAATRREGTDEKKLSDAPTSEEVNESWARFGATGYTPEGGHLPGEFTRHTLRKGRTKYLTDHRSKGIVFGPSPAPR